MQYSVLDISRNILFAVANMYGRCVCRGLVQRVSDTQQDAHYENSFIWKLSKFFSLQISLIHYVYCWKFTNALHKSPEHCQIFYFTDTSMKNIFKKVCKQ
jgi:hypothetical protein